jgi:hypothetical protein
MGESRTVYQSFLNQIERGLKGIHLTDQQVEDVMEIVKIASRNHGVDWKLAGEENSS